MGIICEYSPWGHGHKITFLHKLKWKTEGKQQQKGGRGSAFPDATLPKKGACYICAEENKIVLCAI